jgi:2-polyprenyl-3-methyl-5-hydroxy-6-metoxy-1,4-benzoquinol methylase
MPNFKQRSPLKELLDGDTIPYEDIRQNMMELNTINTLLGGHSITIKGVQALLNDKDTIAPIICEIGCGGGDNLHAIASFFKKKHKWVKLIGVDIKKECIATATESFTDTTATWLCKDYTKATFLQQPDIIFSSLFCHHFNNEQLVQQLQWMRQNCTKGFFINDLHRHPLAYYSIKFITQLFSKSYLVKNDAPISVLRGFTKKEWEALLWQAGITNYSIKWMWAFRHLIIVRV